MDYACCCVDSEGEELLILTPKGLERVWTAPYEPDRDGWDV